MDEIKRHNDLIALISETVQLTRKGNNFWGLCLFHGEKTPSLMVSRERQRFRCWGCGTSGDVFDFVQLRDGVNFQTAKGFLAARAGLRVDTFPADRVAIRQAQEKREKEKLRQELAKKIIEEQWARFIEAEKRAKLFLKLVRTQEDMERPQTVRAAHNISRVEAILNDFERADDTERLKIALAVRRWQL